MIDDTTTTKKVKKTKVTNPLDFMGEVLSALAEEIEVADGEVLVHFAGLGYPQANILEAAERLGATPATVAGMLLDNFRSHWGTIPLWVTTYKQGPSIILVLGPCPDPKKG